MTKKDWEKIKYGCPPFLITVGIIFTLCSVITFWNGSVNYRIQKKQLDWSTTNATISYVEEVTTRPTKNRTTYYDIYYEYSVDDQLYTGIIEKQNRTRKIGSSLEIKYNPKNPAESSHVLEPSNKFIIWGFVYGVPGIFLIIFTIRLAKSNYEKIKKVDKKYYFGLVFIWLHLYVKGGLSN